MEKNLAYVRPMRMNLKSFSPLYNVVIILQCNIVVLRMCLASRYVYWPTVYNIQATLQMFRLFDIITYVSK